ncbi:histidine decarboxylase [Amycolatopsis xylanica]|uniref:Histidine decarboxylase n=1 Tax=Amycolatopsis xylanica TaxID=589385 RepID=A0A1H3T9A9_9PSEU|nr:histidine decarboxylase [Amycolatopsis xylanica]SDZ46458.1 histidine decarboxylase [Amycolatopsis xylanica]
MDLAVTAGGTGPGDLDLVYRQWERQHERRANFLGYPVNLDVDYRVFGELLDILWITVGDPSNGYHARLDLQPFEREVVRFLARVAGADPDHTYGYVTSGGSESNLFGVHLGRERLPDAPLYYSAAAHYTVERTARLLRMEPVPVPAMRDGGIDVHALRAACESRRGRGAVVVATVGTTVLGGIDSLAGVLRAVEPAGERHLHVDAALGGLVARFAAHRPAWGFDAGADSVAISGHKLIGTPIPCGVVLAREEWVGTPAEVEYLSAADSTLACSRNALAPALLWYALRRLGQRGLAARVHRCLDTAEYAVERLAAAGFRPWRNPASVTVVFERPPEHLCRRWRLSTTGALAQLIAMPHVTRAMIDRFVADLR